MSISFEVFEKFVWGQKLYFVILENLYEGYSVFHTQTDLPMGGYW